MGGGGRITLRDPLGPEGFLRKIVTALSTNIMAKLCKLGLWM